MKYLKLLFITLLILKNIRSTLQDEQEKLGEDPFCTNYKKQINFIPKKITDYSVSILDDTLNSHTYYPLWMNILIKEIFYYGEGFEEKVDEELTKLMDEAFEIISQLKDTVYIKESVRQTCTVDPNSLENNYEKFERLYQCMYMMTSSYVERYHPKTLRKEDYSGDVKFAEFLNKEVDKMISKASDLITNNERRIDENLTIEKEYNKILESNNLQNSSPEEFNDLRKYLLIQDLEDSIKYIKSNNFQDFEAFKNSLNYFKENYDSPDVKAKIDSYLDNLETLNKNLIEEEEDRVRNEIFVYKSIENLTDLDKEADKQYNNKILEIKNSKQQNLAEIKATFEKISKDLDDEENTLENGKLIIFFKKNLLIEAKEDEVKKLIRFLHNKKKVELRTKEVSKFREKVEISKTTIKNLEFNSKMKKKMIPQSLYEDLIISIEENLQNFFDDDISSQDRTTLFDLIQSDETINIQDYENKVKSLPNSDDMDFYKLKGNVLFKNIIKEKKLRVVRKLQKIFDYFNAKIINELYNDTECISLGELTYILYIFNDKNIVFDQKYFLNQVLASLDIDESKRFMVYNYNLLNENEKLNKLILTRNDEEVLNEKSNFTNIYIVKLNMMKFQTTFNQTLRIFKGFEKLEQVVKTMIIPVLKAVALHELDITLIRLIHTTAMFALSTIPGVTAFNGPILFLNKKLYALIKSIVFPIIIKLFSEVPGKIKDIFTTAYREKSYLGGDYTKIITIEDLELDTIKDQKIFQNAQSYEKSENFKETVNNDIKGVREKYDLSIVDTYNFEAIEASARLDSGDGADDVDGGD